VTIYLQIVAICLCSSSLF